LATIAQGLDFFKEVVIFDLFELEQEGGADVEGHLDFWVSEKKVEKGEIGGAENELSEGQRLTRRLIEVEDEGPGRHG